DRVMQRFDRDTPALVRLRPKASDLVADRTHVRARLIDSHARQNAPDHLQVMLSPLLRTPAGNQGRPEVGGKENLKCRWDDADDREWLAIERDRSTDNSVVSAEAGPPDPLADHNDIRIASHCLRIERGTRDRLHSQHLEEARR